MNIFENDEENELIVEESVNETQENEEIEQVEADTSESEQQVQGTTEQETQEQAEEQRTYTEEEVNNLISARVARERAKLEREEAQKLSKYTQLESMMKTALKAEDIDDVITKSKEFYEEQGITIPEIISRPSLNERDEIVLAKADAQEIIAVGKEEMEVEANRIASIPEAQRSLRDKTIFTEICQELINQKDMEELKNKGYSTEVLNDKGFSSFRNQFNLNTPISKVYEMYQTVKGTKPTQPRSPGSAKTTNTNNEVKEYYTPEEVKQFSEEDLDNPKLMKAVEKSMQLWGKSK